MMDKKEIEFQKRIQATFRIEAEEHLQAISVGLGELEKTQPDTKAAEIIEVLFREVHSLKGAARSVDQKEIEFVCHPMESIFSALKRKEISITPSSIDLFFKTVEWLLKYVAAPGAEQTPDSRHTKKELIRQLTIMASENILSGLLHKPSEKPAKQLDKTKSDPPILPEPVAEPEEYFLSRQTGMVRIPVSKLDPLLMQAEELTQSKIVVDHRAGELRSLCDEVNEWKNEAQKWRRRKFSATSAVWNEWYDENELRLNKAGNQLELISNSMERDQHNLDRQVKNHLDSVKQLLLLPVGSMVETFPGMVREISHKQNKEIDFIITGKELEIDKRILEELKEPLIHLIRNSIDHGIGKPEERIRQSKSSRGKIILNFISKENGQVEVKLSDDGNGIDIELIIQAAIKSGIISNETAGKLDKKNILNLIYQSGISTSSLITDISGHGLGLSIVRERVEKLNGKITVESEANKGTIFRILLPMTLATFRGIVVKVNESLFILPTLNVERVMKVDAEDVRIVKNREILKINDQIISLVDLGKVLGLDVLKHSKTVGPDPWDAVESTQICLVILVYGEQRFAFKVHEIVDEQQVLVKGLGKLLNRVRNISGATIMSSGQVVPVLNIRDLMKSALRIEERRSEVPSDEIPVHKSSKILVSEDSITSRKLLKSILEIAGYSVTTSVDGKDAFTKARTGKYDLIVTDVDMPKMNGFELAMKIKGDRNLCDTPVVLLTALGSREDRERGIESGADAYLIKSSFDQNNLLDVIKKLI